MSKFLAGLIAGLPLSIAAVIYMLWRGQSLIRLITEGGAQAEPFTEKQWFLLLTVSLALAPLAFGLAAAGIYGKLENAALFRGIALGLAGLLSLLALLIRTPMTWEKIGMNFLVALTLGVLVPLLSK